MAAEIEPAEFTALRRLLADEQSEIDEKVARALVGKRYVRRSQTGWFVTVEGHAAFLHQLRKSFDGSKD